MYNFDQANNFTKFLTTASKRLNDVVSENFSEFASISEKQMKGLSKVRGAEDVVGITNELSSAFMNSSQRVIDMMMENYADLTKCCQPVAQAAAKAGSHKQ